MRTEPIHSSAKTLLSLTHAHTTRTHHTRFTHLHLTHAHLYTNNSILYSPGYGGCIGDMDGDYSQCDFPNADAGHTMVTARESFGEAVIDYLGKQGQSKYRLADRMQCTENPLLAQDQIDSGYEGEKGMTKTFFGLEVFLVTVFVLDLTLRLVVATAPRDLTWCDWFSDLANWIDIIAVVTALIEIIGNVISFDGDSRYQVWGWMWVRSVDPATFRILRAVVSIRFMLQQRHFKDTKIITDTVRQVLSRLAVPLLLCGDGPRHPGWC